MKYLQAKIYLGRRLRKFINYFFIFMIRVCILISGKVTGVFFRAFIREKALSLGLNGWARNLNAETVEAVFEGDETNIKKMIEYCKNGPSRAIIKNIKVTKEKAKGEKSFVIE